MIEILLATTNQLKLKELKYLLSDFNFKLLTLADFNINQEPQENSCQVVENALTKARFYFKKSKIMTLADDTGFEIQALNNQPGAFIKRYGNKANNDQTREYILEKTENIPDDQRQARAVCAAALITKSGHEQVFQGHVSGLLLRSSRGRRPGSIFDEILYLPEFEKTLAEMPNRQKNKLSHRAKAMAKVNKFLIQNYA